MIDSKIGRYDIIKMLGQGSMAIVYEAYDPIIDRNLAIKMLREECCLDSTYRTRFIREAKAAGNLSHPHIVTVHDIGETDSRPYIVMELLEGTTLEQRLSLSPPLTSSETIDICIQLATALHYAHDAGVVHRDIKPSNIVCTNTASDKINVKITDFGIAHVTDSNLTQGTESAALLGTPYYISPEQVLGSRIDGRADLFSLGITMYQLFCGQRPFVGTTMHTLLFQIATEKHRPITNINSDFPLQLILVIDKCLQKNPDDRYQTGQELVDGLNHAKEDIRKHGAKKAKNRFSSSVYQQTLLVSLLLFITMTITAFTLIHFQQLSLQQETQLQGIKFARYVAKQNTETVVRQDWLAVELFIQHINSFEHLQRVSITDHEGMIRGDTLSSAVNTLWQEQPPLPASEPNKISSAILTGQVRVVDRQSKPAVIYNGITVPSGLISLLNLNHYNEFHISMSFGPRHVGKVIVSQSPSIHSQPLLQTISIVLLLYFICVVTVIPIVYVITRANAKSLKLLQNSMNQITSGDYSQRFDSLPLNETGETYLAYNNMADKIQQRDKYELTTQKPVQDDGY